MPRSTLRFSLALVPLLAAAAGCTTETAPVDPSAIAALALLASEAPAPPSGLSMTGVDPNALLIFVGEGTLSCAAPFLPAWHDDHACAGPDRSAWEVIVALPPAQQEPGTYALGGAPLGAESATLFSDQELQLVRGDQCAGGSSPLGGTLKVVDAGGATLSMVFDGAVMPEGSSGLGKMADVHALLAGKTITATRCR